MNANKVFSSEQEIELVDYLKQPAKLHRDLTKREALKFANEYINENQMQIVSTKKM